MQHGVFGPADIQVDRHPVLFQCRVDKGVAVFVVTETQEVPAAAGPLRHAVGFSFQFCSVGVCLIQPVVRGLGQHGLRSAGGFEVLHMRMRHGQRFGRFRSHQTGRVAVRVQFVPDGKWFAPVALTTEQPVTQFVVDGRFAQAHVIHRICNLRLEFISWRSRVVAGIDGGPFGGKRCHLRTVNFRGESGFIF